MNRKSEKKSLTRMGRKGRQESKIGKEKLHVCYRERKREGREREREQGQGTKSNQEWKSKKMATIKTKNIQFCKVSSTHGDLTVIAGGR